MQIGPQTQGDTEVGSVNQRVRKLQTRRAVIQCDLNLGRFI